MALTPEQLAEIQRLKALMQPLATEAQRKAQAAWNAEQMAKAQGKKNGGLQKFLKSSKVKGRLYHGTNKDIKTFDPSKAGSNYGMDAEGMFFTSSPEMASMYASQDPYSFGGNRSGANVMPVHLSLKNPLVITDQNAKKLGLNLDFDEGTLFDNNRQKIIALAKQGGHDGVQIGEDYIAFKPNQIKSAIGNRGTYDITKMDITKAEGGTMDLDAMRLAVMNKGGGLEKFLKKSKIKQRVYHGTGANVMDFKPSRMGAMGPGVYVTTNPEVASGYANVVNNGREQNNPNVLPLHIQARNPFTISHVNKSNEELFKHFDPEGKLTDDQVIELVKKAGHDAIHAVESGEINMLDPRRVKSAIGNRGTYNTRDPIITRSNGGITHAHQLEIEERPL